MNSRDLRINTEASLTLELERLNTGQITFEQAVSNLKRLTETALNAMFHIGYERGAEDLKETIFKPEV